MGRDILKRLLLLLLIFPSLGYSQDTFLAWKQAKKKGLYKDQAWLNLGHYKKTLWHGYKSESLEDSSFFLSSNGRFSPKDELKATIQNFLKRGSSQKALCRFPARLLYLKEKLPKYFAPITARCEDFEKFNKKLAARSVSLVFSSYYLNAPASAFGHTLLRFIKNPGAKEGESYELLDYAANYAAVVTTDNAFLYAAMGILGGFQGQFASMPYFYKIREYNDFESRDIWDYELNLSQKQLDKLIAHLWEMQLARFPYYYLTHNCSYHMLSLLDVVNDEWRLTQKLRKFVIPVDTVKVITQTPGLLKKVGFRPSKQRVLKTNLNRHNEKEKKLIIKAIEQKEPALLKMSSPLKTAQLIDTSLEAIDFLYAEQVIKESPEVLSWKRKFLIARSRLPIQTQTPSIPTPKEQRPHLSHGSRRLSLIRGKNENLGAYSSLELRLALHHLIDPPRGQAPGSSIEMGQVKLRYYDDSSKLQLEKLSLAEVHSLSLNSPLSKNLSWSFFAGGKTLKDDGLHGKFALEFSGYAGFSFGREWLIFSPLIHAGIQQQKDLSKSSFKLKAGPRLQLLYHATWGGQLISYAQMNYYALNQDNREHFHWGVKFKKNLIQNLTFNIEYADYETGPEGSLGFSYYY